MKINATRTLDVEVDISLSSVSDELFKKLFPLKGTRQLWSLEEGVLLKLEDTSYHGSSDWEEVERISDKNVISLYKSLISLSKVLKEKSVISYIENKEKGL